MASPELVVQFGAHRNLAGEVATEQGWVFPRAENPGPFRAAKGQQEWVSLVFLLRILRAAPPLVLARWPVTRGPGGRSTTEPLGAGFSVHRDLGVVWGSGRPGSGGLGCLGRVESLWLEGGRCSLSLSLEEGWCGSSWLHPRDPTVPLLDGFADGDAPCCSLGDTQQRPLWADCPEINTGNENGISDAPGCTERLFPMQTSLICGDEHPEMEGTGWCRMWL